MAATTIAEVLSALDEIIAGCRRRQDRRGYFACLHHQVTAAVAAALAAGEFAHADLIEQLDVTFANRYLDAFRSEDQGGQVSASWRVVFASDESRRPIVVQHLLAACNAHIDLDLGVAVAEVVPADRLLAFRPDFLKINRLLAANLTRLNAELCRIWPPYRLLLAIFDSVETMLVDFGMDVARDLAWAFATELAGLPPALRPARIQMRDELVARQGELIVRPPLPVRTVLTLVRAGEYGSVAEIIQALAPPPRGGADAKPAAATAA